MLRERLARKPDLEIVADPALAEMLAEEVADDTVSDG